MGMLWERMQNQINPGLEREAMPHRLRWYSGFTLIELLVVIAIIAVLDFAVAAGRASGPRGGAAHSMSQQPQADRRWRPTIITTSTTHSRRRQQCSTTPHTYCGPPPFVCTCGVATGYCRACYCGTSFTSWDTRERWPQRLQLAHLAGTAVAVRGSQHGLQPNLYERADLLPDLPLGRPVPDEVHLCKFWLSVPRSLCQHPAGGRRHTVLRLPLVPANAKSICRGKRYLQLCLYGSSHLFRL